MSNLGNGRWFDNGVYQRDFCTGDYDEIRYIDVNRDGMVDTVCLKQEDDMEVEVLLSLDKSRAPPIKGKEDIVIKKLNGYWEWLL